MYGFIERGDADESGLTLIFFSFISDDPRPSASSAFY